MDSHHLYVSMSQYLELRNRQGIQRYELGNCVALGTKPSRLRNWDSRVLATLMAMTLGLSSFFLYNSYLVGLESMLLRYCHTIRVKFSIVIPGMTFYMYRAQSDTWQILAAMRHGPEW